jgi:predicted nucleic acid-binding protein
MKTVFADSFYFFALLNPNDPAHGKAVAFSQGWTERVVTSAWVLAELADGWARPVRWRQVFLQLLASLQTNPDIVIEPCSDQLFQAGINLYGQRPDKEWSLTDCISFVVMQRDGITEALTGDHHFEQAGFVVLLK